MRTTIDFRDDLMTELQQRAARDNATLKDEVNACLERALGIGHEGLPPWKAKVHRMGGTDIAPEKVWDFADSLEAEAYAAKRELMK